jgi:hypothetical protein
VIEYSLGVILGCFGSLTVGFMPGNFQQTQRHQREVLRVEDLSDAELAALAAAEPPAWARRFDHELDPDAKESSPTP